MKAEDIAQNHSLVSIVLITYIYTFHIILTFQCRIHLTFSFLKYRPFAAKHASIFLTNFFMTASNSPSECIQKSSGFSGSSENLFQSSDYMVHIQWQKQPEIALCEIWVIQWLLQHFNIVPLSHFCTRAAICIVTKHCLDEESTIEKVALFPHAH